MNIESIFSVLIPVIFVGSIGINLLYWILVFPRFINFSRRQEGSSYQPPVSVVISAKNEAENLQELIPLLLDQKYSKFEIIVADDCSTDRSATIVQFYVEQYPNIRLVSIKEETKGKKHALTQAISAASYDDLLFTDADCRPTSNSWIQEMVKTKGKKQLVLGYGPMIKTSGWLNNYIRYETFLTAIQYLGYAAWGRTYMGVGRNMGYDKRLFMDYGGYEAHRHIPSGDDDLFVNAIADPSNVAIAIQSSSHMYSHAKKTFGTYYRQKTRHYSTSVNYKWGDKLSLGLFAASQILLYISMIGMILMGNWQIAVVIYGIRGVIIMYRGSGMFRVLEVQDLWKYFIGLDFLTFVFYLLFIPASFFPKRSSW